MNAKLKKADENTAKLRENEVAWKRNLYIFFSEAGLPFLAHRDGRLSGNVERAVKVATLKKFALKETDE